MPDRRPYASRGVPRRTTSRKSGAGSGAGFAALMLLLLVIATAVVWVVNPFASARQIAAQSLLAVNDGAGGPAAADSPGAPAASMLQMADVAVPASTAATPQAGASPTSIPTVRQWDTAAAGVTSDAALARQLDRALVGVDGHVSVAVKDLGSGRGAVLDGNREQPAASLYKLPVLFAVFEAGLNMGEALPITEEARAYDSGSLELGVGETLTVAEALERMVTISDNTAAVMLGSRVGGGRVNADIAALGMDATHYSLERMTTSASDMLHFLDLLAHGELVSTAASADMVHLLLRQRVNDRLPRLLPDGVEVAHKTGNLPGTVNDVGIIYGPTSTLAVVALVSDTADETAAASGIAAVALAAFNYFEQPEQLNRPTVPRPPARPIPPVWRVPHPVPTATTAPLPEETPLAEAIERAPTPELRAATAVSASAAATVAPTQAPTLVPTPGAAGPTTTPAPAPATPTNVPPTRPPVRATQLPTAAPGKR